MFLGRESICAATVLDLILIDELTHTNLMDGLRTSVCTGLTTDHQLPRIMFLLT
jgi:hypothetical protein